MQPTRQPPDWDTWLLLDDVEPYQAVALSLGIEPRTVEPQREGWQPITCPKEGEEFQRRLFIVNNKARSTGGRVPLVEFVMWAGSVKWILPWELITLAHSNSIKKEATENTRGYGTQAMQALLFVALNRAGINPTDIHAASELAQMTDKAGISVTEKTIRKILNDLPAVSLIREAKQKLKRK
jgi:hypothetical protein